MGKPIRILIVEDSEDDAALLVRELRRNGYDPVFERVGTAQAMTAVLEKQVWDVIICDYNLPNFSAPAALTLLQKSGLDLPFIIVSGSVGEDVAVAAMKSGAHDYIMKGNLKRLIPAIEREVQEAEGRQKRKQAEERLQRHTEELEHFNRLAVGRELRMVELKQQINALSQQLGKAPPYRLSDIQKDDT
jgi:DNA-binding NtrC family response regulator